MNENINPFKPSPAEAKAVCFDLAMRIGKTHGPDEDVTVKAGDLVVMLGELTRRLERIAVLNEDKARLDWLEQNFLDGKWAVDWGLDLHTDDGPRTIRVAVDEKRLGDSDHGSKE